MKEDSLVTEFVVKNLDGNLDTLSVKSVQVSKSSSISQIITPRKCEFIIVLSLKFTLFMWYVLHW